MERTRSNIFYPTLYMLIAASVICLSIYLMATPYYHLAFFPALGVLFLVATLKRVEAGFYLIIFLIPFEVYRALSADYQFLTVTKIVGFWLVLAVFFKILHDRRRIAELKSNLWMVLLILFLVALLSALLSDYRLVSLNHLRKLATAYTFFALTVFFIDKKGFKKTLPYVIIGSITIASLLSIVGYIFNLPYFVISVQSDTMIRAIGGGSSPNHFASMIIFPLPLMAYFFFTHPTRLGRALAAGLFVLNLGAIVLTYSRGAALVTAVLLLLMIVEHFRRFKPIYLGMVTSFAALILVVSLLFVPSSYWDRQKSMTDTRDSSISSRISYLMAGWEEFKESPILGTGIGTFSREYADSKYAFTVGQRRSREQAMRDAHNTYIEYLIGMGLMGLITFLFLLALAWRNFHRAIVNFQKRGEKNLAFLTGAYRLSMMAVLLYYFMLTRPYSKYFWLILALSQIALRISGEKAGKSDGVAGPV